MLLFRACITERCIPEVWKTAIVVALHKKGSVHNPNEYRPVSLTCILCKVYEKLVRDYILEGIEKVNKVFQVNKVFYFYHYKVLNSESDARAKSATHRRSRSRARASDP